MRLLHASTLSLLAALAACGGATPPKQSPLCAAVPAPCGGDLSGTWNATTICEGSLFADCGTDAKIVSVPSTVDGSATFTAGSDQTTSSFGFDGSFEVDAPASCLSSTASTCAAITTSAGATCSGEPSDCSCDLNNTGAVANLEGTYSTSGTTLAWNNTTYGYCVQGSMLYISTPGSVLVFKR